MFGILVMFGHVRVRIIDNVFWRAYYGVFFQFRKIASFEEFIS